MSAFDPDALDAYVRHGFRQDGDLVRLKCDPNTEADTFDNGGKHSTWDSLDGLSTPIVVVAGPPRTCGPSMVAPLVAEEAINGRFIREDGMDHFGPMTHPAELADLIASLAADV